MTLTLTLRPTSTAPAGTGTTFTGAASVAAALADNVDTSYATITGRLRLDVQVCRLKFATPAIPAGAKVVSVSARRRVRSVLDTTPKPSPTHWFGCNGPTLPGIGGSVQTVSTKILKQYFTSTYPVTASPATVVWVDETVWTSQLGPDNQPWDPATNLAATSFFYDLGNDLAGTTQTVSAVYLDVVYQQASAVAVTGPTGTVTATSRPDVTWTLASPDSAPQESFQVVAYTDAQHSGVGFAPFVTTPTLDSGRTLGEDLKWTLTDDIVNATWWSYVRSWARFDGFGDFVSNVGSGSWTQNITGCPTATLSTALYDAPLNRVQLTFVPSSSSPTTAAFAVQVKRFGSPLWGPVRGGKLIAATGMTPITIYDHEMDLNQPNSYRVLAYGASGGVLKPAAAYSSILSVTASTDRWWLFDPLDPTGKTTLPVKDKGDTIVEKQSGALFYPVSGPPDGTDAVPISVTGPRYAVQGHLKMMFDFTDADAQAPDWAKFQAMRQSRRTLMLQKPAAQSLYIASGVGGASGGDPGYDYRGARRPVWIDYTLPYAATTMPPVTA